MSTVYVVVTEEWFGGGEAIKVFAKRSDAEAYAIKIGTARDLETSIIEIEIE